MTSANNNVKGFRSYETYLQNITAFYSSYDYTQIFS